MLGTQLLLGSVVVVSTAVFHVAALVLLSQLLSRMGRLTKPEDRQIKLMSLLAIAVLYIIAVHSIEAWVWGAVYLVAGEFDNVSDALYFSVVTSTTLGYGDITLSEKWRLLSSFEAMGGLILFGASTAFLLESMRALLYRKHQD